MILKTALLVIIAPGILAAETIYKSAPWLVSFDLGLNGMSCSMTAAFQTANALTAEIDLTEARVIASFPGENFLPGPTVLAISVGDRTFFWNATQLGQTSMASLPTKDEQFVAFVNGFAAGLPIKYSSEPATPVEINPPLDPQALRAMAQCVEQFLAPQ